MAKSPEHRPRTRRPDGPGRDGRREGASGAGNPAAPPASTLPRWVVEALVRVTPAKRRKPAVAALEAATDAFIDGRFADAVEQALEAKQLSPRDASVREILGLAAYRTGDWTTALRELRTYRRLAGEVAHMAVELDCLRALGRRSDVDELWRRIAELDGEDEVVSEARVVYGSVLVDEGRYAEALEVVSARLHDHPAEQDLRRWYVAARAAALAGDETTARRLRDAIIAGDPGFPGMDELDAAISGRG